MSKKSSFRAALERQGATPAGRPNRSNSPSVKVFLKAGRISQPVQLARTLTHFGLSLRKAHEIVNRVTRGEMVAAELRTETPDALQRDLESLGLHAVLIEPPEVNVKQVREQTRLSQVEFALWYGIEVDTLQNWEQGRYPPDAFSKTLLQIIALAPEFVGAVRAGQTEKAKKFAGAIRDYLKPEPTR